MVREQCMWEFLLWDFLEASRCFSELNWQIGPLPRAHCESDTDCGSKEAKQPSEIAISANY